MTPTYHVITVHYRTEVWLEPQLRGLRLNMPESTRYYGVLNDVDARWNDEFDWSADLRGSHAEKLNEVAAMICATAPRDDFLVFVDGDAFPVAPITPALLAGRPLAAIRRDENLGDPQPHPSFCICTVGLWQDLDGDWRDGPTWTNSAGDEITDVGGTLLRQLDDAGVEWTPMLRTAAEGSHPVFFAVYGDAVYHHGAGFRAGFSRAVSLPTRSLLPKWVPVLERAERSMRYRAAGRRRERARGQIDATTAALYPLILADPDFFTTFDRSVASRP